MTGVMVGPFARGYTIREGRSTTRRAAGTQTAKMPFKEDGTMESNLSNAGRIWRVLLGAAVIAAGVHFRNLWGMIGIVLLISGIFGICLGNLLFKKSCGACADAKEEEPLARR